MYMWIVSACNSVSPTPMPVVNTSTPTITFTPFHPVAATPSPTPLPLAAVVNGEPITMAEFESEINLFLASGSLPVEDSARKVIDELINQRLLAQAAKQAGYQMNENVIQEKIDHLSAQIGGEDALNEWLAANGYSMESFRLALGRASAAAWMRDKIIDEIPSKAEQVRVRQILLDNSDLAAQVYAQIQTGTTFASLANRYDPVMAGEMGWFPRGYLRETIVEEAAFALGVGEVSDVVESSLGFHILQVVERDPERVLTPDARLVLQENVLKEWLETSYSQSDILILISP
jgi:peptidyl-prolyl cis-trans isomerase C